jgi:hypothetical protein
MNGSRALVWDLPVRLFHWLFAGGFIAAAIIALVLGDDSLLFPFHAIIGLVLVFLVVLRVIWGFIGSRYARMYGSEPGIDPYTRTVSDVYQDLFGEGSFVGKGIYDVDAFEHALENRFPENQILSHDLLESAYARSALLSDVELYEE